MDERLKLLEGKVDALFVTVGQIDKALGVVMQWMMLTKNFMDSLQVNKPVNTPKEEKK